MQIRTQTFFDREESNDVQIAMSDTSSDAQSEEFGEGAAAAREATPESEEQEEPEQETTDLPESVTGTEPIRRTRLEWREVQTWDVEELGKEECERSFRFHKLNFISKHQQYDFRNASSHNFSTIDSVCRLRMYCDALLQIVSGHQFFAL